MSLNTRKKIIPAITRWYSDFKDVTNEQKLDEARARADRISKALQENDLSALQKEFGDFDFSRLNLLSPDIVKLITDSIANLDNKRAEECIPHLEEALAKSPGSHQIQLCLAYAYLATGDTLKSRELLTTLLETKPRYADAIVGLGHSYLVTGDKTEAKKYLLQAIQLNPKHAGAHSALGNIFVSEQDFKNAKAHYHLAIQANAKGTPQAHAALGEVFAQEGKHQEAIQWISKAVALDPDYGPGWCSLAILYAETESWGSVEECTRRVYDILDNPEIARKQPGIPLPERLQGVAKYLLSKGRQKLAMQHLDKAENLLRLATELSPRDIDARAIYASALFALSKIMACEKQLRIALMINPNHFHCNALMARVMNLQGETVEAAKYGFKAHSLNPDFKPPQPPQNNK